MHLYIIGDGWLLQTSQRSTLPVTNAHDLSQVGWGQAEGSNEGNLIPHSAEAYVSRTGRSRARRTRFLVIDR